MTLNRIIVGVALTCVFLLSVLTFVDAAGIPKGIYMIKTSDGALWEMTLDGKGKYNVTKNGSEGVRGIYKVTKDELEFTDVEGPFAEKGTAKSGTYKWKLTDNKLEFTIINDQAEGRSSTLTSGPWEMKK